MTLNLYISILSGLLGMFMLVSDIKKSRILIQPYIMLGISAISILLYLTNMG